MGQEMDWAFRHPQDSVYALAIVDGHSSVYPAILSNDTLLRLIFLEATLDSYPRLQASSMKQSLNQKRVRSIVLFALLF